MFSGDHLLVQGVGSDRGMDHSPPPNVQLVISMYVRTQVSKRLILVGPLQKKRDWYTLSVHAPKIPRFYVRFWLQFIEQWERVKPCLPISAFRGVVKGEFKTRLFHCSIK